MGEAGRSSMNDVTLIIKTFERQKVLRRLLKSIRHFYSEVKIIVADDSRKTSKDKNRKICTKYNAQYIELPYDSGLSRGRNEMVQMVKTEFFLLLDDDYVFIDKTDILKLKNTLLNYHLDIVGGGWIEGENIIHFEGIYELEDGSLHLVPQFHDKINDCYICDFVHNFFLARTASVKQILWDEKLKLMEHTDFFLRARGKLKVGYVPIVTIFHARETNWLYSRMRNRSPLFYNLLLKKHNLKSITDINGRDCFAEADKRSIFSKTLFFLKDKTSIFLLRPGILYHTRAKLYFLLKLLKKTKQSE